MPEESLEFSNLLAWDEGLPRPQWQLVRDYLQPLSVAEHDQVWSAAARQWLRGLAEELAAPYAVHETDHFLMLSAYDPRQGSAVLRHCEACRRALRALLPDIAEFQSPGKLPVVHFAHPETYYTYVSYFHGDGEYGSSGGMHIRDEYPHVALYGWQDITLTLAHELTHAAIAHRSLPLWLEEGLTQLFECDAGGRSSIIVTPEIAKKHKQFWQREGLAGFWRGESFFRADDGQELSYQLAEILMRLLIEEHRPRWLGFDQRPVHRLYAFLSHAHQEDSGQARPGNTWDLESMSLPADFSGRRLDAARRGKLTGTILMTAAGT